MHLGSQAHRNRNEVNEVSLFKENFSVFADYWCKIKFKMKKNIHLNVNCQFCEFVKQTSKIVKLNYQQCFATL